MRCIVFTLAFDSSPIKGEGDYGWLFCLVVCPALWFPAYAGMTVMAAWNDWPAWTCVDWGDSAASPRHMRWRELG